MLRDIMAWITVNETIPRSPLKIPNIKCLGKLCWSEGYSLVASEIAKDSYQNGASDVNVDQRL